MRGLPLISLPRGTGLRARLDEACAAAGFSPLVAFEASAPEVVADLAGRGLGAAILPGPFAEFRADRLAIVHLEPELRGRLVFGWRDGGPTSPAGRALVSLARRRLSAAAELRQLGDGETELGEHAAQQRHGQPEDIAGVSVDALDDGAPSSPRWWSVRGTASGSPVGDVGGELGLGRRAEPHGGRGDRVERSGRRPWIRQ